MVWVIGYFNHIRLAVASSIELIVNVVNMLAGFDRSTVGNSRIVGSKIFSIVVSLGFVYGLSHVFVR